ncbi:myosin heavy chain, clone 203-like [Topomyia yanbarensis]|uniref:myosin heavy chain, clone 203-like n=1 Tax=Topomyia yanbarensis TaxID=2498891 RepID=UPI00273AD0D7|nr:myosin heavy chain, clone 203-like [Topomyia yanbarensis]
MDLNAQVNSTDHQLMDQPEVVENVDDRVSSGDESNDSEGHEICQDIVAEVHALYQSDKSIVLVELVKSRIQQIKLKRQIDVLKLVLDKSCAAKTKLQLNLACSNRMVVCLQEAAKEQANLSAKITQQYNIVVDMIGEIDLKRLKLIKDSRERRMESTTFEEKMNQIEKELQEQTSFAKSESERNCQLREQIEELVKTNYALKDQLTEADKTHQTLISSHSVQLNEIEIHMTKMNEQLAKADERIASEIQTNSALKNTIDSVLAEKTHLSMEVTAMEIKFAQLEKEMEVKLQEMENSYRIQHETENIEASEKYGQMKENAIQMELEVTKLTGTIDNMQKELKDANERLDHEKNKVEEFENKVGGMQAILEDRNNEIYSLHAKLNGEQKRFEEQKQQLQQKCMEIQNQLEGFQKESEVKDSKIEKLENDLASHAAKISFMDSQIKEKEGELLSLPDKLAKLEQANNRIAQLEAELSKMTSFEQQLLEKEVKGRALTPQITSTPCHEIDLGSSSDVTSAKKPRISDQEGVSGSNYSTFQSNVLRKRAPLKFFGAHSVNTRSPPQESMITHAKTFFGTNRRSGANVDLNLSFASTVNIDDEPLETTSASNSSSIRMVKPFFRKQQEKQ